MALAALTQQRWEVVGTGLGMHVHHRAMADARCVGLIRDQAPVVRGLEDARTGARLFETLLKAADRNQIDELVIQDESFLDDTEMIEQLRVTMDECGRWFTFSVATSVDTLLDTTMETLVRLGVTLVSIEVEPGDPDLPALIKQLRAHGIHVVATRTVDPDLCDESCIQRQIEFLAGLDVDRSRLDFEGGMIARWAASAIEEDVRLNCSTGYRAARTAFMGYLTTASTNTDGCMQARHDQIARRVRRFTDTLASITCAPIHEMERYKAQNLAQRIDQALPPGVGQRVTRFLRATSVLMRG